MQSKTRIVVLHMKELVYTGIFLILGILFIILLVIMFSKDKESDSAEVEQNAYIPGVYHTTLTLGESTLELQMVLDKDRICSADLVNMDETITTMYPLVQPAMKELSQEICEKQTLEDIAIDEENRYTYTVLLKAVQLTLDKAKAGKP